ncbi:hypothetical protein CALVIDRAFT_532476 [Calocera viscosa TUFC12733]|uniref:Mediator of RNA polymerase II transcription subunit 4 n=1 Tax=Calocera viscosa (strain TUFC12733) TaxID=1330018 RepID=A0A167S9E2_CALVF|nr:hypothetical protein CALVIDRAFT_532476 [Calocera viscosa TUFC12733]
MSLLIDGDIQHLPMREALLQHLDRLNELSFSLFSSLVPSSSAPPRPLPDPSAFLAVDKSFAEALRWARVHQLRQGRIERLKTEVGALEEEMRAVLEALEEGGRELEEMVGEGDAELVSINHAKENPIAYPELMQYAQHLASYTSVPPSFPPYRIPLHKGEEDKPPFHLHAPTQEMLRRGRLNAEGTQMSIVGEEQAVGVRACLFPFLICWLAEMLMRIAAIEHPPLPDATHHELHVAPTRPARPAAAEVFNDLDLNLDL